MHFRIWRAKRYWEAFAVTLNYVVAGAGKT